MVAFAPVKVLEKWYSCEKTSVQQQNQWFNGVL